MTNASKSQRLAGVTQPDFSSWVQCTSGVACVAAQRARFDPSVERLLLCVRWVELAQLASYGVDERLVPTPRGWLVADATARCLLFGSRS